MATIYAEDVGNYWKTSVTAPDSWIDKTKAEIIAAGGRVIREAFGDEQGRAAFMIEFTFGSDTFRAVWPVLPTRKRADTWAARVQAATAMYHDVKGKCVAAKFHGLRAAFFQYAVLPDGRTAAQVATPELVDAYPRLLAYYEKDA
jgi:hypothetical protein